MSTYQYKTLNTNFSSNQENKMEDDSFQYEHTYIHWMKEAIKNELYKELKADLIKELEQKEKIPIFNGFDESSKINLKDFPEVPTENPRRLSNKNKIIDDWCIIKPETEVIDLK